jgi:S-adenosylmethionine synthetase
MGVFVDTYDSKHVDKSDGEIAKVVSELFDLRPGIIEKRLKLRNPIYGETAAYGHMGRETKVVTKRFDRPDGNGIESKEVEVELFTWEKLDYVDKVKEAFGL